MLKACGGAVVCAALLALVQVRPALADDGAATRRKVESYLQLARDYKAEGNWDKAELNLLEALKLDAKNVKALTDLAWIYNETRKYKLAETSALAALLVDDDHAEAWREMGFALLKQEKYSDAEKALWIATTLNAKDPSAFSYLAEVKDALGKTDEASEARQKAKDLRESAFKRVNDDLN